MSLICAAVALAVTTQACSASSGTVSASGGIPTSLTGPSSPTGSTGPASSPQTSQSSPSTQTSQTASTSDSGSSANTSTTSASAASTSAAAGHWQPTGPLAQAEAVDQTVGPDQKVTVLWPKGQPADHALVIKLLAKRNGDKLDVTMSAANHSGQKVSLLTGAFGDAAAVDDTGQTINFEDFDKDWTLTSTKTPYLEPDDPINGVVVIDAPKSGNTFNMYWTQAVNIGGIILVRDIPIVG